MRGRGWSSNFSVGNPLPDRGVPLVSAFTWDTGVQVSAGWNVLTATVARHQRHGLESASVGRQRRASRSPYGRRRLRPSA